MSMVFTSASLPTGENAITRIEELIVWATIQAQPQISTLTDILEIGRSPVSVCRQQAFPNFQGDPRCENLVYVQLVPDWNTNGKPLWKSVAPYPVS